MDKINIIYFSGTGSTRLCAQELADSLRTTKVQVTQFDITANSKVVISACDKLIIMYPVYFMNAPIQMENFIDNLNQVQDVYSAIVSVSAGGEYRPNLASRIHVAERLSAKGYNVIYENMLVMPANCIKNLDDRAAACLIKILPHKVRMIAEDIISGKVKRSTSDLGSHIATELGRIPQRFGRYFGRFLVSKENCTGCGKCVLGCPQENIYLHNNKAHWESNCSVCLKCVYECPEQAIKMKYSDKFLLKDGYTLEKYIKLSQELDDQEIETIAKLHTQGGVRQYLLKER